MLRSIVASFTDAWIEPEVNPQLSIKYKSHLLQMRGLKRRYPGVVQQAYVASFTDAWIETFGGAHRLIILRSHLLQMRGLKLISLALTP